MSIPLKEIFETRYHQRMPRQRLDRITIEHSAIALVDRAGFEALTLSGVAGDLGVGPSALYTHVDGLEGLRYLVAVAATGNLTHKVREAAIGTGGGAALHSMGKAYRGFASAHPGQFASTLLPPRTDDDDLASANADLVDVFRLVFAAGGLGPDDAHLAARSTRSAIHGFLALEHNTGTGPTHDAEYDHLLASLERAMATPGPRG